MRCDENCGYERHRFPCDPECRNALRAKDEQHGAGKNADQGRVPSGSALEAPDAYGKSQQRQQEEKRNGQHADTEREIENRQRRGDGNGRQIAASERYGGEARRASRDEPRRGNPKVAQKNEPFLLKGRKAHDCIIIVYAPPRAMTDVCYTETAMKDVIETSRRRAPFEKPQSAAFDGASLWIGSIATSKVYRMNPRTLVASRQFDAPGKPWGMTCFTGGELRVICGEGDDDDRYVRRLLPARGCSSVSGTTGVCSASTNAETSRRRLRRRIKSVAKRMSAASSIWSRRKTSARRITGSLACRGRTASRPSRTLRASRLRQGRWPSTASSSGRIIARQTRSSPSVFLHEPAATPQSGHRGARIG